MKKESLSAIEYIRKRTFEDMTEKLTTKGKCALIRCVGFGKTWALAKLTTQYKKVLFIYPAKIIKKTALSVIENISEENYKKEILKECKDENFDFRNVDFVTYYKLARMNEEELQSLTKYDLIIMDECHKCGAKQTRKKIKKLLNINPLAHYVGATGTPNRSDAIDVIEEFFEGITTFEYTIHNAFTDGIIQRPIYCYCTQNPTKDLKYIAKEEALTGGQDINNILVKSAIKSKLLEISNIYNIPNIIRDVTNTHVKDKKYMKYIVFFSSYQQLHDKLPVVINWFNEVFPGHNVNEMIVTQENSEYAKNVDKLDTLKRKKNQIDIIACVDMLNLGYHVDDLTGIIMYRGTKSSIIYIQQLGRVLSTGTDHPCIVFDIVDNIHRKSIFDLSEQGIRRPKRPNRPKLPPSILTESEQTESCESLAEVEKNSSEEPWYRYCNCFEPEDFIATGHYASYKELLAKVLIVPIVEKVKRALEEHRRVWGIVHDTPYPSSIEGLLKIADIAPELTKVLRWQNLSIRQFIAAMELIEGEGSLSYTLNGTN